MELLTNKRRDWDKGILFSENIKQIDDWTIYKYAFEAPMYLMSPMDFAEKRTVFESNGTYYGYYTNVPDSIAPPQPKYSRGHIVFGGTVLRKEGNDYVYYSLSQFDPHVFLKI